MTLFRLAIKNVKGNFNSYLIYFISMIFSMVIYYTFISLQYNKNIKENIKLSDTMNFMFMGTSVILILFVSIFIIYSNTFFIRRRKKEVGIYSILGLRKKTIARMLFYENLLMGMISLLVGIFLGSLLSKFFSLILMKLMGTSISIDFSISYEAILQTIIVFIIIILFTSIQCYRLIYRFKLIELFNAEKKGEAFPKVSLLSAIIGFSLLIVSYYLILRPLPDNLTNSYISKNYGLAIIILIIGTYLFFNSITIYLIKLIQKNKFLYYRGTTLINTSNLLYRVKGNAKMFTLITLLSATTISLFAATYGGYFGNEKSAKDDTVFSYTHLSKNHIYDSKIKHKIEKDKDHHIKSRVTIPVVETYGKFSFNIDYLTKPVKIISNETFNNVSHSLNRDNKLKISGNEAMVIKPRATKFKSSDFKNQVLKLQSNKKTQKLHINGMVTGSVLPFNYPDFFVIVSDKEFHKLNKNAKVLKYIGYEVENEKSTKKTSEYLNEFSKKEESPIISFYDDYKKGKEGNALNIFIFGFLGLVFLSATGTIIYFKQLTEANENQLNYEILKKIGIGKKELYKSVAKQTLFIFGLPLVVSLSHGLAAIYFISNFMSNLIGYNMFIPLISSMVAFVFIYLIYYVLTVRSYIKIVYK